MCSHWTNPTIVRRPTIAVLSAAALLVACDQPAGPSRSGRGIVADAQAATVSAHGNGQVAISSECSPVTAVCEAGGQGAQFSFDFSGDNFGTPDVPVTGRFSVKFRETGDVVSYQGLASISPAFHSLAVFNVTCTFTPAVGTPILLTGCYLTAVDEANSDYFQAFFGTSVAGGAAAGPVVSGGMQID